MLMLIECSVTVYPLDDVNSETTVSHDIDAVVCLPRTKQDGARWHKLSLHMFAQLHKQRLLEMTKGSAEREGREREREGGREGGRERGREREGGREGESERERERERGQLLLIRTNNHFLPNTLTNAELPNGDLDLICKPQYRISLL